MSAQVLPFAVLAGFKAGDEILHAAAGGMAFGPRGVPTRSRTSATPAAACW